ncbi:putative Oligopeptide ABC transporter, solute-binding protein [uncultured Sporomusa sp.]|uniref:Putative Oligopeptide ABC transporter, solute-binding protein n=1 Tax=uncultured Sporomusa sp. TaxID=307249 RepID=A0A212M0N0_9FIRM|nr:ABC transporter substrate-binding protein [uncultured Sporomusa sp.]SCM83209.1 putative Oligopeptide ABC transporter, solute-binding protein [uncultured Sporomusa sp.]
MSTTAMQKKMCLFVLLVFALTALAGCGGKPASAPANTTLKVGWDFEMPIADPVKSGYFLVRSGIMETLVAVDFDGRLVPGLALEWQAIDATAWKFTLRPNVKFHDGSLMTAKSVKLAVERFAETAKTIPLDSIEIVSDHEILIKTRKPVVALPAYLATPESSIYGEKAMVDGKFTSLIGTGPYKFVQVAQDKSIVTEGFAEYWKGAPHIKQVINRHYPDAQTRFMALQSGEVDFIRNVLPANAKLLQGNAGYQVAISPVGRVRVIYFNTEQAGLADHEVRLAISHALDREAIVKDVLGGYSKAAAGMFPDNLPWGNPAIKASEHSVATAKTLLDKAGWVDNGSGIREKQGKKLEFNLITYRSRPELPDIALVVQAQLAAVGIKLNIQVADIGAAEKAMASKNFDMVLVARGLAFTPDPSIAFEDFRSTSMSKYRPNYVNKELDSLLEGALRETDPAKRQADYYQAQEIIDKEIPAIFLNYYVHVDAYKKTLRNFRIHPTEAHVLTSDLQFQ